MSIIGDGIVLGAGGATASIFVTGLSETDTVTASKDGKTVIGKWTQKSNPSYITLPIGYTQLEYIQSTGTQYVKTGISGITANFSAEIDFQFTSYANDKYIFGYFGMRDGQEWRAGYYRDSLYTGAGFTYSESEPLKRMKATSAHAITYQTGTTCSLFGQYAYNANNPGYGLCNAKLFSCIIRNNGVLIRDFIPAKRNSDSVVGLYDIVNDVFYTNAGTGTFTAGAEVPQTLDGFLIDKIKSYGTWTITATDGTNTATQNVLVDTANTFQVEIGYSRLPAGYTEVEFIRSNGQQYLELDYFANTKSVLEIDFIINSVSYTSGWCQLLGSESNGNFSCWLKNNPGFNFYTVGGNYLHSVSFVGNKYKLIFGNGSIVLNGSTIYTYTASSFTASASVVINGIRGYLNGEYPFPGMTIYPFHFKEDDVVVAEYIPCVRDSDNSVGVFNIVSETFIGNSGSGSFIAGDSV